METRPPSGATFSLHTGGRPAKLIFTPSFERDMPLDKTDGPIFEVYSNQTRIYQSHILAVEPHYPVMLNIPEAHSRGDVTISFVTSPGHQKNSDFDWAIWKNVKILTDASATGD